LLEPVARKRARPVLRGRRRGNAPPLPDWRVWLRREAPCCIPGLAGRNLEDIPGSDGLLKIRKVKGTIACQETGGRAQAYGAARREIRVIWRKLDCLNPSLQKG